MTRKKSLVTLVGQERTKLKRDNLKPQRIEAVSKASVFIPSYWKATAQDSLLYQGQDSLGLQNQLGVMNN